MDSRAVTLSPALRPGSVPCKLGWTSTARGLGGHHWLTPNVANVAESTNVAIWRPQIPREGRYQVFAYVPLHSARVPWQCGGVTASNDTHNALYVIQHRDGMSQVSIDQAPLNNVWADLGTYNFGAGSGGAVSLSDLTGEPSNTYWVDIDELKFVPVP